MLKSNDYKFLIGDYLRGVCDSFSLVLVRYMSQGLADPEKLECSSKSNSNIHDFFFRNSYFDWTHLLYSPEIIVSQSLIIQLTTVLVRTTLSSDIANLNPGDDGLCSSLLGIMCEFGSDWVC